MYNDLISRQAAIDAIENTDWYHQNKNKDMVHGANSSEHQAWYKAEDVYKALKNVPSAQPEQFEITDEQAILHLQSTGWMQNHDREMYEMGLKEQLADDSDSYYSLVPSAQPEPKKGKWIGGELGYCTCCGHEGCASDMWDRCEKPHCPNCGAEMEGVQT